MTDTLENLLLSLQNDGSYAAFLVTYATTAEEKLDLENGIKVDLLDRMYFTAMDDHVLISNILSEKGLGTTISSKEAEQICLEMDISTCGCNQHDDTTGYNGEDGGPTYQCYGVRTIYLGCYTPAGGAGEGTYIPDNSPPGPITTTGNNNGSTSGGTGTSTTNPNPDATSPTPPCTGRNCPQEFDPSHDRNCEELHKISTQPTFQNEFLNLENNLSSQIEKGFALIAVPFQPLMAAQPKNASSNCSEISIPVNPFIFAFMHTHPSGCINGTQPMFGPGDIKELYDFSQNFNPDFDYTYDNSIFTIFMTVGSYHYAIKINDFSKLEKINSIYQNKDSKEMFIEDLDRAYSNSSNNPYSTSGTQTQLAKAFLKVMSSPAYDFGISLYKTSHTDINTDTSNWKRLKIDENGNLDDSQTCN